ncbi:prephenate dehydrogenase/arogenate dehydrogenase family protein [Clostridium bovifaecis]|uniref:Prephenate dehydrogenase/arogenate dehydrogenase family protein n=1 Tax=Clostridium bovifaecis TaxID=2184719 RepID=A0A6I6EJI8_9CLOT|nr:prephenate dehydrogenase/arogenate dehydrogenase family protein [Clostridium bovifaecis]
MKGLDLNITIVGLGLIGGSYALALKELQPKKLYAVDKDEEAIKVGEEMGIIDKGFISPEIPLKESDLIIICIYPKDIKDFVKNNIDNFKLGSVITDVTGIKREFAEEINAGLRKDIDFVFGHPMAGREFTGVKYASKEIFKGANYIITPTERNKEESIKLIEDIAIGLGCKNVEKVTVEKHDEIIGFTSQLPHVIAVSLVNSDNLGVDVGKFTGDSYRDLTRIARINTKLWTELFMGNRENLINQIEEFEKNITDVKTALINKDMKSLSEILSKASKKREEMS